MLVQLKKHLHHLLIVFSALTIFISCQKDVKNEVPAPVNETPDLSSKVNSSVSGFVTDENNAAVQGATVKAGTMTTSTDEYGYFEIKNVQVVKTAAVVTVTKPGYFNGIKTYGATADKAAFFRIKLIPKTNTGTIDAAAGGNVTLSNGLSVALPASGVVVASSNAAYTGPINVAAFWINPEANDLTEIMPGDLRGLDNEGLLKGLTTYGMAAVELTSASGELLQIASGKKATITMPLSSLLSGAAPASIPLWYFDENNGLWKQDGSATKTGNAYIGEVSHFSFWNCDIPNATVPLTFTVVDQNGTPVANAHVEIHSTNSSNWGHVGGWTDGTGYVSVFVAENDTYELEIYSSCNYYGGTPDHSQTFSVTTTAVNLGNVTVPSANAANVSGTITNCSGNAVMHGYLIVQNGYYYTRYPVDNTGAFNFSTTLCNGTMAVNLIGEDMDAGQQSSPVAFTLVNGPNTIGNIQACGITTSEFIHYSVDGGTTYTDLTAPGDSLYHSGNGTTSMSYIVGNNFSVPANNYISFSFDNTGIAAGSAQNLLGFGAANIMDQTTITTPILVNITEFGAVGGYIAGNFAGTVTGSAPANTPYSITCSFRVRRNF